MALRKSPNRNTFQKNSYLKNKAAEGKTPENDDAVKAMVDYYENWNRVTEFNEADPKWQKNNLEYDLRTSEMVAEKCNDDAYAQHLYAALCNNEFIKNDIWPILKDERWSCSWRHAGGIIADMREEGDYIDWYCSGMKGEELSPEEFDLLSEDQQMTHKKQRTHVAEGIITDEIKNDLLKLGWVVVDNED